VWKSAPGCALTRHRIWRLARFWPAPGRGKVVGNGKHVEGVITMLSATMAEAVFASSLQPSDAPTAAEVVAALRPSVRPNTVISRLRPWRGCGGRSPLSPTRTCPRTPRDALGRHGAGVCGRRPRAVSPYPGCCRRGSRRFAAPRRAHRIGRRRADRTPHPVSGYAARLDSSRTRRGRRARPSPVDLSPSPPPGQASERRR
jgi:hypothetical protein